MDTDSSDLIWFNHGVSVSSVYNYLWFLTPMKWGVIRGNNPICESRLSQPEAEGRKGYRDQLDVLLGERDADDGDGQDSGAHQMGQGDLPAE